AKDASRYVFRHHTMLIHTSSSTTSQNDLADRVIKLWDKCAFNSPTGLTDLEQLWEQDFSRVTDEQTPEALCPDHFSELVPYLAEAIELIEKGTRCVMVVNYSSKEAPDFGEEAVWKIIIGGNKLSRGYTVEGLTVSYYRRVASTADTLMQMGRWFGFRQGYQDLVRIFLGVSEGKKSDVDLVAMFKQVCLMEERFRQEITRYLRSPGQPRITPKQIPPLISVIGQLPPTSRNKMFNAVVENRNYGGRWSQPTLIATSVGGIKNNTEVFQRLLSDSHSKKRIMLGGKSASASKSRNISSDSWVFESSTKDIISLLHDYQWLESKYKYPTRPADIELQIEFLRKQNHGIASWLVIAPQRKTSYGSPLKLKGVAELSAKERGRLEGRVFQNFGEPAHRVVAEFLADVPKKAEKENLVEPNTATKELAGSHQGIVLVYPVREHQDEVLSIGFEMLFPKNNLGFDVNFTVRNKSEVGSVIVSV
ncbi:MAG: Z1 domain-containing protein, partial [Pyrinomonadaceae bacterium]|nr:Z1 domain-containing protein [Pyrinomonadaceae bacterium]